MEKPKVLITGLGEVGLSLFELLKESNKFEVYCWDINKKKIQDIQNDNLSKKIDVLYICYRCINQEDFINITIEYIVQFKPKLTIIHSTVPPGTTNKIHELIGDSNVVHSPIRGMHYSTETMKRDLLFWTKYIGGVNEESALMANKHFKDLGLKTKILKSSIDTELAKLFETTYRAWMIACFQEFHRISRTFGADFDQITDFLDDTHRVRFDRPVQFPDVIGGHCLISNSELLLESYDSEFVRLILKSNEKRREEIKDPEIAKETNKIRKRVEDFHAEITKVRSTTH